MIYLLPYSYTPSLLLNHVMKKAILIILPLLLTACIGSQKPTSPDECPDEIEPVCGKVKMECITMPCDPIEKTFPNRCFAEVAEATDIREGECDGEGDMTDEEKIKAALEKKPGKEDIEFVIDQEENLHKRGTFKDGGKFLVTKVGTKWIVVHDSDDPIDCSTAINYGFPEEMIEDCEWAEW